MDSRGQIENLLAQRKAMISFEDARTPQDRLINVVEPSPCTRACPAGVNVKAYVSLIAAGRFQEALEVVRQRNPLPGICGRVCTHPCEAACNLGDIDSPVAICWLKRFVADYELTHPQDKPEPIPQTREEKVAIIGSGPAGLTAANDLVRSGFGVTVFEALSTPGGMLVAGIPAYRLPRNIVAAEIDAIRCLGVEIQTDSPISGDKAIDRLFEEGYRAVFLAIGAHKGRRLGVPGEEDYSGIIDCITFLNEVNLGKARKPGDKVIVIGGGSSAVDSARTALRLGSEEVHIVYRRSRKEMPAHEAEIVEAEREGVQLHYLAAPMKVLGKDGKVTAMECQKMKLGKPDESGRRRPVPIEGSEFEVEADTIITAISQGPELSFLTDDQGVELTRWLTLVSDEETMASSRPGVFAGGDAVTGPSTVIDAIAAGHVAARSIVRFLDGEALVQAEVHGEPVESEIKVDRKQHKPAPRATMPMLEVSDRISTFEEVDLGFEAARAISEAQRCQRCGPCSECYVCVPDCDKITTILSTPNGDGEVILRLPGDFEVPDQVEASVVVKSGRRKGVNLTVTPVIPWVKEELCRSCGDCVAACEYEAVKLIPGIGDVSAARVDPDICRGCGACVAVCSTGAMMPGYYTGDWLTRRLTNLDLEKRNVVVFACHWNGSHIDEKTLQAMQRKGIHPEIIHTMCSGRINPGFVLEALESGAEGVLITGCSSHDCHYDFGAKRAQQMYETLEQLVHMVGFKPELVSYQQIPESDSAQFMAVVEEFVESLGRLKPRQKAAQIEAVS
jgi:NADPH-dependent glutamate synthase beta subunit-like oxidoreductase/coenzyme F420-reducing hydrogenase delta subunit/NAD-dependent dihydropyrimidine dehydrogenase PreA subunit